MTRSELEGLFGEEYRSRFSVAFTKAKRANPALNRKICTKYSVETSLTEDEILFVCTFVRPKLNRLEMELVRENYVRHEDTYISKKSPYIEGTERFLEKLSKNPSFKCCANCSFIRGKTITNRGLKLHPYCIFYRRFLERLKIHLKNRDRWCDIFKDSCPSYRRGEVKLFYREP